ncbi:hypothetical protein ACFVSW_11910 [Neobacillus sp. NPDC058068]|uniref:hypothetical protein n=1 Tax=Neobacillus sp. NPDC058068 TaxID=3346325 RepID=UPI0036DDD5F4
MGNSSSSYYCRVTSMGCFENSISLSLLNGGDSSKLKDRLFPYSSNMAVEEGIQLINPKPNEQSTSRLMLKGVNTIKIYTKKVE